MKEVLVVGTISVTNRYDVRIYIRSPFTKYLTNYHGETVLLIIKIPENDEERQLIADLLGGRR